MIKVCQCRWIDAGKFLTGFSAVGSIAIPAILFHSEVSSQASRHKGANLLIQLHFVAIPKFMICALCWDQASQAEGKTFIKNMSY